MKVLLKSIKRMTKLFKLSWDEQRLLFEAFFLSGIARFAILSLPFNKLAAFVGKHREESSEQVSDIDEITIGKIKWAVSVVCRFTPWESKCFVQALAGQIMLKKRKIDSTLYLGVARDKEKKLLAHAWLRSGNIIVTGGPGYTSFTQVAKFASKVERRE
ncbi:lasso peptide biosynthesis B2 protein [Clostridium sp. WILCCON 0269]|uniref:Lasso peptide biosynthesis B2 protein n=1 Tax=Candidatus Clostridium eludens TaxID=3381663 RepID=A0ABW8SRT8_9CLOT